MKAHCARAGLLVAIAVLIVACSSPTPGVSAPSPASASDAGVATKTSEGGQVTVVVDWAGPAAGALFDVTLDTHSVDLDGLDLATATLRNDRGETMTARPWAAPKGGHHRKGRLSFDGEAAAFLAGARWVELVIVGVGDVPERTLRWDVAP